MSGFSHVPFMYMQWGELFFWWILYLPIFFVLGMLAKWRVLLCIPIALGLLTHMTWYEITGKDALDEICKESGGLYLNSSEVVSGFLTDRKIRLKNLKNEAKDAELLLELGFLFVEYMSWDNKKVVRFRYSKKAEMIYEILDPSEALSKYSKGYRRFKLHGKHRGVAGSESYLYRISDNKKISGKRAYYLRGRLAKLLNFTGKSTGGYSCHDVNVFSDFHLSNSVDYWSQREFLSIVNNIVSENNKGINGVTH